MSHPSGAPPTTGTGPRRYRGRARLFHVTRCLLPVDLNRAGFMTTCQITTVSVLRMTVEGRWACLNVVAWSHCFAGSCPRLTVNESEQMETGPAAKPTWPIPAKCLPGRATCFIWQQRPHPELVGFLLADPGGQHVGAFQRGKEFAHVIAGNLSAPR
jgi:hypothetical protein